MIRIPKSQHHAVEQLMSSPPEKLRQLIALVAASSPSQSFRALSRKIESQDDGSFTGLVGILQMLAVLSSICKEEGITFVEMANELISTARKEAGLDTVSPVDGDWDRLVRDIARLLESSKSVLITWKASQLISDHEHVFCADNSKIISDIRSIFLPGELAAPVGAVVVHMLKLAYHQGSKSKDFYVALDSQDVRVLRDLLDRAIAKEAQIKESSGLSKIPYISGDEEPN